MATLGRLSAAWETLSTGASYASTVVTAGSSWLSSTGSRNVCLDLGDVLVDFAVLAYRPIGTKVHFDEDGKMGNDSPIGFGAQSVKRFMNSSSSGQLYSCSVALYHAIHLMTPSEGRERLIPLFDNAIKGARNLAQTYADEGDLSNAQNINNTHIRMLLGRGREEYDPAAYYVPDNRDNPFSRKSLELWREDDFEGLKQIGDAFHRASVKGAIPESVEINIKSARVVVNSKFEKFLAYKMRVLDGGSMDKVVAKGRVQDHTTTEPRRSDARADADDGAHTSPAGEGGGGGGFHASIAGDLSERAKSLVLVDSDSD